MGALVGVFVILFVIGLLVPKPSPVAAPVTTAAKSTPTTTASPITTPSVTTSTATAQTTQRPSSTTQAPTTQAPVAPAVPTAAPATCNLQHTGDLVVRTVVPRVQPEAQLLGDIDLAHCESTLDFLSKVQPTGPGYCTTVGRQADNPRYNVDEVPAPPIPNVIAQYGAGC